MTIRTSRKTVTLTHSFRLDGCEEYQPAGDYAVDIDEELIEGLSFLAYRRVAARMRLPAVDQPQILIEEMVLPPATFDALVELDRRVVAR
jgi:hypothetical protein